MRRALAAIMVTAAVVLATSSPADAAAAGTSCPPVQRNAAGIWQATPTTAPWQWQLQGKIDTGVAACVFDVDGFEPPQATVAALQRSGRAAICYLDVGSWESYRPDVKRFPRSVIGRTYEGFPD